MTSGKEDGEPNDFSCFWKGSPQKEGLGCQCLCLLVVVLAETNEVREGLGLSN